MNDAQLRGALDQIDAKANAEIAVNNAAAGSGSLPALTSGKSSANSGSSNRKTSAPMKDDDVVKWADSLNKEAAEKYSEDENFKILQPNGYAQYKANKTAADFIILRILNSTLSNEQKSYLLFDKFGITENEVNNVLNDKHYTR